MIGTAIIAAAGYGLALLLAYEFVAFGYRSIFVDGLDGGGNGKQALGAAVGAVLIAALTRWLTGGQF